MAAHALTTKNGLVLLEPVCESHRLPATPVARRWTFRPEWRRLAVVVLLLAGIVSFPVNCALAEGPHSIFVDPAALSTHQHHHASTGASISHSETARGASGPLVSGIPEAVSMLMESSAIIPLSANTSWDVPPTPFDEFHLEITDRTNPPESPPPQ